MPAQSPKKLHQMFATAMTAGDAEALMALYEPESALVPARRRDRGPWASPLRKTIGIDRSDSSAGRAEPEGLGPPCPTVGADLAADRSTAG